MAVVWGVFLLAFGVAFTLAPLSVARATGHIRFVPYPQSPSREQMRYFRVAGVLAAAAGIAVILVA